MVGHCTMTQRMGQADRAISGRMGKAIDNGHEMGYSRPRGRPELSGPAQYAGDGGRAVAASSGCVDRGRRGAQVDGTQR